MANVSGLFRTVADRDYLGFWANNILKPREVADFLDFDKRDIAKVAHVAPASVRFDEKIPKEVFDRLQEYSQHLCAGRAAFRRQCWENRFVVQDEGSIVWQYRTARPDSVRALRKIAAFRRGRD